MSVETRHTEKSVLYSLLRAKDIEGFKEVINRLMATMEPEDVELVQKRVAEAEKEEARNKVVEKRGLEEEGE